MILLFLSSFGLCLTWAAATPMFGVPDEISHMVRAAAAARGDLDGRPVGDGTRMYRAPLVLVPGSKITGTPSDLCYAFTSSQSADCMVLSSDLQEGLLVSTASSYPPLYYLLVGWPSRIFQSSHGLYAMRAASALWFAALISLAAASLHRSRLPPIAFCGLALAATPMAWFVGASVSPSSMAIGAGLAAWCGGYLLFNEPEEGVSVATAAWRFGLPLCLLLLVRRDSLLWGGLMVVTLLLVVERKRFKVLIRSPHALGWGAMSISCAISASRTGFQEGSRVLLGGDSPGSAAKAFGALPYYIHQMIGVLGWLDTFLPSLAYVLWFMAFGTVFLCSLAFGRWRFSAVCAFVVIVLLGSIVAVGAQRFPYFQGRYALPFAVGAPIFAGVGIARLGMRLPRRPLVLVLSATSIIHLVAFYQQYRRYAISGSTSWWVFGAPRWEPPPAPFVILLVLHVVFLVLWHAWLLTVAQFHPFASDRAPFREAANR